MSLACKSTRENHLQDTPVNPFMYQVSGHTELLSCPGKIFKPLNARECGVYEQMQKYPDLACIAPDFFGTLVVNSSQLPYLSSTSLSLQWSKKKNVVQQQPNTTISLHSSGNASSPPPPDADVPLVLPEFPPQASSPPAEEHASGEGTSTHVSSEQCSKKDKKSHNGGCRSFLVIQDLTSSFKHPSIMDIKLGSRQHGDECSPEKIRRQTEKCANSTSATLAFRLCGMLVYLPKTHTYRFQDKYVGRDVTKEKLKERIGDFFENGSTRRLELIPFFVQKFKTLAQRLENTTIFRMYSVSMLAVYNGDNVNPEGDARIIDFAKTYALKPGEQCDDDVLKGLHNLISYFEMLYEDWNASS